MHSRKWISPVKLKISNLQMGVIAFIASLAVMGIALAFLTNSSQKNWAKLQYAESLKEIPVAQTVSVNGKVVQVVRMPILMYHHVGDLPSKADTVRKGLTVSTKDFEAQTKYLHDNGYTSITLQNLLDYKDGKFILPAKPVIFTFDDGYSDVFDNAVPILKKYDFIGSFAIITQFPGIKTGTNEYATWDKIKDAKNQGMEIVSHTQDHFDGTDPRYTDKFILQNFQASQADLNSHLGKTPLILIYPFGHYDERYINLANQAGFAMGITTHEGKRISMDKIMEVPRIRVPGDMSLIEFERAVKN